MSIKPEAMERMRSYLDPTGPRYGLRNEDLAALLMAYRRLRADVRWVMSQWLEATEDGEHIPAHMCWFTTKPDAGYCPFHEEWYGAAEDCGLMNDWAEADAEEIHSGA